MQWESKRKTNMEHEPKVPAPTKKSPSAWKWAVAICCLIAVSRCADQQRAGLRGDEAHSDAIFRELVKGAVEGPWGGR